MRRSGTRTATSRQRSQRRRSTRGFSTRTRSTRCSRTSWRHGIKVKGGDRLGKTIIFAKNQAHAEFIVERFDANYPQYKGAFARIIHHGVKYAQSLIDDFSSRREDAAHRGLGGHARHRHRRSRGRESRVLQAGLLEDQVLADDRARHAACVRTSSGPDDHKTCFYVFDYCGNFDFFQQELPEAEGRLSDSLGKRLFTTRLELVATLDTDHVDPELRQETAATLHAEVAAMNLDNFLVRPKRRVVEKFAEREAWSTLDEDDLHALSNDVAGLPSELESEDEEAKRFDLLMYRLQLAILRQEPAFSRLRNSVIEVGSLLEEQANIPMVRDQLHVIADVQSDEWWQDVTVQMVEDVRKKLRSLVRLIEKTKRKLIYTDFEDELGEHTEYELLLTDGPSISMDAFRAKTHAFLREHSNDLAIHRLRMNKQLTVMDLTSLERMLADSGIGDPDMLAKAAQDAQGLGLFVRSLIGMDRGAAMEAFADFLTGRTLTASQIEFVDLIVDHLSNQGVVSAARFYESPFTDIAPTGPQAIFTEDEVQALVVILDRVRASALAA